MVAKHPALERIAIEAVDVGDINWRISLLQEAMDKATQKLMRHLPGVSFSELKPVAPIVISEAFDHSRSQVLNQLPSHHD